MNICYTLVSDGSSDRALMPILDWLLREHCPQYGIDPQWADLARLRSCPKRLPEKIRQALDYYPCDLLFVHRDAEKQGYTTRHTEISAALAELPTPPAICVIPVRMQEAWLLFDEKAIRLAAGNPSGRVELSLPGIGQLEQIPDPKEVLFELIRKASERSGTRLKKLKVHHCAYRLSQAIEDYAPLRQVPAFRLLEEELARTVRIQGWSQGNR